MLKVWLLPALAGVLAAQTPVTPTAESVGSPRGQDYGGYNILQSWETGYRSVDVTGDRGKYRSDVNYPSGLRLFGSSLVVNSKNGQGRLFDEVLLQTQGLANDPYQFATLRVQKNKLYRYDLLWRSNEYLNPSFAISNGLHLLDTVRRLQDQTLWLLPQSSVRFFLGYSRNTQSGAGLATTQLWDARGDEFPFATNIQREQNEYRIGGELASRRGYKLFWQRAWEYFKDDSGGAGEAHPGANPADRFNLTSLRRNEPYHGSTPSWRLNLLNERARVFYVNARYNYSAGRRAFTFDDSAIGSDRSNPARTRQLQFFGDARRPVSNANLTLAFTGVRRLTLTNHTGFHHTRMEGDGNYREINNASLDTELIHFQFLGIRALSNSTDALLQVGDRASVRAGYLISDRRVRSIESSGLPRGTPFARSHEQSNRLNAGQFGVRLRPAKPLSINLDTEVGRADRPFLPLSERNYHAFSGRAQWRQKSLTLGLQARTNYNTNSVSLWSHSSRNRYVGADASWSRGRRLSLDGSYAKIHTDTLTGLAYFAAGDLTSDRSYYLSNIHLATAGAHLTAGRADIALGFSRVQDTARPSAVSGSVTQPYQSFPLTYASPYARVSILFHSKVRWNFGLQSYHYTENLQPRFRGNFPVQNYDASTIFTSMLWSF
ncbi:MAG: hypothetical protein FJW40_06735 [Acidobacteria bacterium]|nr:hypothetical protein [Acidobacteriota bacterium]